MFSIDQFHQLFHYFMNRSKARKRLDKNDTDTARLQNQVAELEKWREDLESRLKNKHQQIDDKFTFDDNRYVKFKAEFTEE
jgi:chaperonin cofactor prefoldin